MSFANTNSMKTNPTVLFPNGDLKLKILLALIFVLDVILIFLYVLSNGNYETESECDFSVFNLLLSVLCGWSIGRLICSLAISFVQLKSIYRKHTALELVGYVVSLDVVILFVTLSLLMFSIDCNKKQYEYVILVSLCAYVVFVLVSAPFQQKCGISMPEVEHLCESLHLNVGYGASVAYFHNYLKNFIPHKFKERVRHFSSMQQVKVVEKLIILLPDSCKVKTYIDETAHIERARELLPYTLDVAGIKRREYNITVYHVRVNLENRGFWCAVEYAQPLKQIWDLKNRNEMTQLEMEQQRDLFKQCLEELLDSESEADEACLLLPYDDSATDFNIAECLYDACSSYLENEL